MKAIQPAEHARQALRHLQVAIDRCGPHPRHGSILDELQSAYNAIEEALQFPNWPEIQDEHVQPDAEDDVCHCGEYMKDHRPWGSCTNPLPA